MTAPSVALRDGLEIRTDLQTRMLYASDASMYEVQPGAVAFPRTPEEVADAVRAASASGLSITPRAAATSLAGQTIGTGMVVDISRHLTAIEFIDPVRRMARVQPGVIRDSLNREVARHGLFFAPDPATSNRCMIGGMIGNNSSGSFSLRYGTTKDHVTALDTVLSSGEHVRFAPVPNEQLLSDSDNPGTALRLARSVYQLVEQHQHLLRRAFPGPELIRSNAGYGLDRLLRLEPFTPGGSPFSLVPLLCGSEGTLALTTAAELRLTAVPEGAILAVPQFSTIANAMRATVEALQFDPSAVELVDDQIIAATYGNPAMEPYRYFLDGTPKCFLIVQFDTTGRHDPARQAHRLAEHLKKLGLSQSVWIEPSAGGQKKIWELRKAGLGLLMGVSSESKSPTFCEDTAVPVENLPAYIEAFESLLERYGSTCVFYAHASVGELHLRPVLDLKRPGNIARMETMQGEITALVKRFGGTISGEHGDGRARSAFLDALYGPDVTRLFRQVKQLFDPLGLLNPGVITSPAPFIENLRYTDQTVYPRVAATKFRWHKEGGFEEALERCNGAGVCRKLEGSGGTMCPSYRATLEERDSTRGRANLFRQVFSGKVDEVQGSQALRDALELCLGCKACKTECPAGVDMTRMKAEFLHQWHKERGASISDRLMAYAHLTNPLFRFAPPFVNRLIGTAQQTVLFKRMAGTDPSRPIPVPAPRTFQRTFREKKQSDGRKTVLLFVDHYSDVYEPETARAAVDVLESFGYHVKRFEALTAGRALISLGFLDGAAAIMNRVVPHLVHAFEAGIPVIGLEPSEVLTIRDDYPDLCDKEDRDRLRPVFEHAVQLEEFLLGVPEAAWPSVLGARNPVYVHGHCHAKALQAAGALPEVLRRAGAEVTVWDTGCCGMAGAFGYKHAALSLEIGEQTLFPKARAAEDLALICASGFSCRHQLYEGVQRRALHPAAVLKLLLNRSN